MGSHLFQRVASFLLEAEDEQYLMRLLLVLISFREWLHSYETAVIEVTTRNIGSHLFQRVASFLQVLDLLQGTFERLGFSSLSESGFIPTCC